MAEEPKKKRARKPRDRKFENVVNDIEAQASSVPEVPPDVASPALPDTRNYGRTRTQMDRIRDLMPRAGTDSPANQRTLQIIQNIRESMAARGSGREGQGLVENVEVELRGPTLRDLRRAAGRDRTVRIGDEEIPLPQDYAQRKKFRKYRLEEMQKLGGRRREDAKTRRQLQGGLGQIGYQAGRDAARVRAALPQIPMPSARNPLVRFGLRYGKNIGGMRGGLAGLGALAGGALIGKAIQGFGEDQEREERRQEMLRRQARQDMLDMLGRKEQKQAVQMSIDDNLAKLQQTAPDLYMRVASGRLLPQGAVVIGGVPRQDLLNQLGMAMSNGQFSE